MVIEPAQHSPYRSEVDHPFTGVRSALVILTQTSIAIAPSEAAFHNPAFGQDVKAALLFWTTHNIKHKGEQLFHPLDQLASITLIRPHPFEAWECAIRGSEQLDSTVAIS